MLVEISSARVLEEDEQRIAGWTLLSPEDRNIRLSAKLEEKVLLLTKVALYVVSFNYSLEKVVGFTRVPLTSITSIQKGSYILSPLQEASRDPAENAGFIINFSPTHEDTRYSTYSIQNRAGHGLSNPIASPNTADLPDDQPAPAPPIPLGTVFFAFKVLPREFAVRGPSGAVDSEEEDAASTSETCRQVADRIVKRVRDQCQRVQPAMKDGFVIERDVVR